MRLKKTLLAMLIATSLGAITHMTTVLAEADILLPIPPPAPQTEPAPPPKDGYVWTRGYWGVEYGKHVWVPGHFELLREGEVYTPAHWERRDEGWVLIAGAWKLAREPIKNP